MALKHHAWLAIIALAALSSAIAWADNGVIEVQQQGNISYVTGGISKDESDELRAKQTNYNLRIMNTDKLGHFSSNTRIVISYLQNNTLLDATSGPLFYTNLPKGKYLVEGYNKEQTKKQVITITNKKPAHIRFVWPEDVSDTHNY